MPAMELLCGVQINSETVLTVTLNDVNLKTKVKELKRRAEEECNLPKDSLELIYCGLILEDDATVESSGLKDGSMVYMLKKKECESPVPFKHISEESILQLTSAFKSFNETSTFRSALHRLSKKPDVIENIISSSPGLHKDPVALSMLQDPDLMTHLQDIETVKRIAEQHPVLIEAAQNIAAAVHEEAHNAASGSTSSATARSYSMDNLTLEEEMARDIANFFSTHPLADSLQYPESPSNNSQASSQQSDSSSSTSTSAGGGGGTNQVPVSNQSTGVVTSQMFMEAMRQVALTTANPATQVTSSPTASVPTISSQANDLQRQLAQMHEMGLQDDVLNVQALQFTNGDVQAAIELVFSGFGDN